MEGLRLGPHPPSGAVAAADEPGWGLQAAAGGEEGRGWRMESRHVLIPIKAALCRGGGGGGAAAFISLPGRGWQAVLRLTD